MRKPSCGGSGQVIEDPCASCGGSGPETTFEFTAPSTGTYTIDPAHSSVEAVARHLVVSKVRGSFTAFSGTIVVGERPEESFGGRRGACQRSLDRLRFCPL